MSFFNSLQQMVSSGVANLSLSPKRFSFSKESSTGSEDEPTPGPAPGGRSASMPGMPRVVPPPGGPPPARRKTLVESPRKQHQGSFKQRQPLAFCRRRLSWPEVDQQATSGVQETDGSFFESYTAVSWKLENRRLMTIQEGGPPMPPPPPQTVGVKPPPELRIHHKELEQLYIEVMYTITNKVGASSGQFTHYQEDLYSYAQKAFGVSNEQHRKYLSIASEEKPPIVVLNVVVMEAEGLEAKDANGYSDPYCMLSVMPCELIPQESEEEAQATLRSPIALIASTIGIFGTSFDGVKRRGFSDPYCMLGIQPGNAASPPPPPPSPGAGRLQAARTMSEGGIEPPDTNHHHDKLRKHHSFRLSFKRRREHRDSLSSAVPAKFIRATSVRPQTLNPKWNEKFRFDIDDVASDILHLDIWDHDDESSVLDAVSKLNEVRGVKGLGRFFKQIAQSARSGSQDDFLGCVNIPIQDIPSTGLDCWYKLEARTQRSNIQGRLRLKLWLSTREDRGNSEEDNWAEFRQQVRLVTVFANHEKARHPHGWNGELPQVALSVLHQHAVQGDMTELQLAAVWWLAYSRLDDVEPSILIRLLAALEHAWPNESLTREEEDYLAESFNMYLEFALQLIRKHRSLFPHHHKPSVQRLESLLKCLGLLSNMKAFWKCCPFNKEIRGEIISSLKKGTHEWFDEMHRSVGGVKSDAEARIQGLVKLITSLIVDLQRGLDHYNQLFESTNGVPYFSAIYKQLEKLVGEDLGPEISNHCQQLVSSELKEENAILLPPGAEIGTSIFELYLSIQEFASFREHLPDQKNLTIHLYYQWFEPAVDKWLDLAKYKAFNRIKKAAELNRFCSGELIVKHSTSAVDTSACFYQMKEFWMQLAWPDLVGSYNLLYKLIETVCSAAIYYSQLTQQKLQDTGYYEDTTPYKTADEMCVAMNDLEYVRRGVSHVAGEVGLEAVLEAVEAAAPQGADPTQWRNAVHALLDQAADQLFADITMIITRIGVKMCGSLKKSMFHLAWSPDSLPTSDAIAPLLEYLDNHLLSLNAALIPHNFELVLQTVWDVCLLQLGNQMDGSAGDRMAGFYDRLYEALDILVEFFHAEGKGLTLETIKSDNYRLVEQRLGYHKTETDKLVTLYHAERLYMQLTQETTEYGVLTVRAYFNHDSLCVEVLNARDVIPLDPNGYSDPFVIVELLPKSVFSHCSEQITNVQKKTLNPLFDECFEFSVTLDQCKSEGAMIAFTVMDHDVLTSDDFAGEAFLSLATIPGVALASPADNFHGLKPVELPLMHQKNKNHPILQTLEMRSWDKAALEFVKKQRMRISTS